MTRDEVMALSDDELRIKAAELAGWVDLHLCGDCPESGYHECKESDPQGWTECTHLEGGGTWETCNSKRVCTSPDYPHDIGAAWELMPTLIRAGFAVDVMPGCLTVLLRRSPAILSEDRVEASFGEMARFQYVGEGPGQADARATTRAFVLAMTQEKP